MQVRLLLPQPLAFVAHLAERSPRKRQAGGSRPLEGSYVLVAQRQRHQPEMLASARSNRAEDTEAGSARTVGFLGKRAGFESCSRPEFAPVAQLGRATAL